MRARALSRPVATEMLLLLACVGALAQTPNPPPGLRAGPVYTWEDAGKGLPVYPKIDVVLRANGGGPGPVGATDLKLVEGGMETGGAERVRSFGEAGYGIEAIMLIDCSGSMRGRPLEMLRASLYRFVSEARSQDEVGVVTFADDTRFDVPFDSSRELLTSKLEKIAGRGHETHLYDALLDALSDFDGRIARRELIVVSDGHDEGSKHTIESVIEEARRLKIAIDSIGVSRSNPVYLRSLQQISAQTGGGYQLAKDDAELQTLVGNGIAEVKQEPVATFEVRQHSRDGKDHPIQVRWVTANLSADAVVPAVAPAGAGSSRSWRWGVPAVLVFCGLGALLWWKGSHSKTAAAVLGSQGGAALPHAETRWEHPRSETLSQNPGVRKGEQNVRSQGGAEVEPTGKAQPALPARTRMVAFFESAKHAADGSAAPFAWLEIVAGPRLGDRIAIQTPMFRVGAVEDNDLMLTGDPTLSAHHAALMLENRIWMVQDAGSTNGTFVNEERLAEARRAVSPGDLIRMGVSVFRVGGA